MEQKESFSYQKWYAKNREKRIAYTMKWQRENRERHNANQRAYYQRNKLEKGLQDEG